MMKSVTPSGDPHFAFHSRQEHIIAFLRFTVAAETRSCWTTPLKRADRTQTGTTATIAGSSLSASTPLPHLWVQRLGPGVGHLCFPSRANGRSPSVSRGSDLVFGILLQYRGRLPSAAVSICCSLRPPDLPPPTWDLKVTRRPNPS